MPRTADLVIPRPRLEHVLDQGRRHQVTLVAASPGAGKTTLLADHFGASEAERTAWLTLTEHDNSPLRLARVVAEALRRSGATTAPGKAQWPGEALLDTTFEQLLELNTSCTLVLDDVHELTARSTLQMLDYLVERAPETLHIVMSARADPPLSWGRLDLDGRLTQIRDADLAFNRTEIGELLVAHGIDPRGHDVTTLLQRSEGWAAGLRLAIGAMTSGADATRFLADGDTIDSALTEYLVTEVLDRQDDQVRTFLLWTSIAEHLTPELAVALTGEPGAGSLLRELFHRGLFLSSLDGTGDGDGGYRYHPLFRTVLQNQLHRQDPAAADRLHHEAATWYLAIGMIRAAEPHARAARDWPLTGRLLLERWLREIVEDTDCWPQDPMADIPAEVVLRTPALAMVAASEACRWGKREEAELYLGVLPDAAPADLTGPALRAWEAGRLLCDATYGWSFGANDQSRPAVEQLRTASRADPLTPRFRQVGALAQAEQDIGAGHLERAHHTLEELADLGEAGWPCALASAMLALLDACAGALCATQDRRDQVIDHMEHEVTEPVLSLLRLATTLNAAQRGGGGEGAAGAMPESRSMVWRSWSLRCTDLAVQAAAKGAPPFFVHLDQAAAHHPLAERALVSLGVLEVLDTQGQSVLLGDQGEHVVLEARRRLADGALVQADALLAEWLDKPGDRHPRTAVEAAALATIAAHHRGDATLAGYRLRSACELALATGIAAPLLALEVHLRPVLELHVDDLGSAVPLGLELLERFQHPGSHHLIEGLTEKELAVLRRLPTLMSNVEIAEALHLSVNTVKTHLKALYRKLGVHSRREAVQRGRELELV